MFPCCESLWVGHLLQLPLIQRHFDLLFIKTLYFNEDFDHFFVTETWLSAQGDDAKTVELAPSRFDVK